LEDCLRHPFEGLGSPEPLKENLSGFWLRRIGDTHRLVYGVNGQELVVSACRYDLAGLSFLLTARAKTTRPAPSS